MLHSSCGICIPREYLQLGFSAAPPPSELQALELGPKVGEDPAETKVKPSVMSCKAPVTENSWTKVMFEIYLTSYLCFLAMEWEQAKEHKTYKRDRCHPAKRQICL